MRTEPRLVRWLLIGTALTLLERLVVAFRQLE